MTGYLLRRLLLLVPSLLGITFVTFVLLELAPADRAQLTVDRMAQAGDLPDAAAKAQMLERLRRHYGLVDAEGQPVGVTVRYLHWLGDALRLELGDPDRDSGELRRRILGALPVTALLAVLALAVACIVAIPLGSWLGMREGSRADRCWSQVLFAAVAVPEFLAATLLLLLLGGAGLAWFPSDGLQSLHGAGFGPVLDLFWHLCLPVAAMAVSPIVVIVRFLRASVSAAGRSPFACNLRALGSDERRLRHRLLHNGIVPLCTLLGGLLPQLMTGSVVVENVFALDGLGRLALGALLARDQDMVMALTLLGALVTLAALVMADLMQRWLDPRVGWRS